MVTPSALTHTTISTTYSPTERVQSPPACRRIESIHLIAVRVPQGVLTPVAHPVPVPVKTQTTPLLHQKNPP